MIATTLPTKTLPGDELSADHFLTARTPTQDIPRQSQRRLSPATINRERFTCCSTMFFQVSSAVGDGA